MKIGYIRISTADQNTARQELLMEQLGVDEVYVDRMSGKNTTRPELQKMMEYVRRGDTVIVESISRFARNTRDLLELVEQLSAKGVEFISKKETIDILVQGINCQATYSPILTASAWRWKKTRLAAAPSTVTLL